MALERLEGVPNPLIIKWIRNYSKILKELIAKATVAETIKSATILEMDELFSYCKKQNRIYVWLAVDRKQNQILDFAVTETLDLQAYRRLARLHRKTSCYSKAIDMVSTSLLLLFNEKLLYPIID